MFSTQFDQNENCDYVAQIINYLNSTPVFSVDAFEKLLMDIDADNLNIAASKAVAGQQNRFNHRASHRVSSLNLCSLL